MEQQIQQNLLTLKQACLILNVHPDTLRRWEKQKILTSVRIGARRDRRYKLSDIYGLADMQVHVPNSSSEVTSLLKTDCEPIRELLSRTELVMLDISETLMSLYPSRGEVYASIAYSYGFNLDPAIIESEYSKQYDLWEKDKLFSDYGSRIPVNERNLLFRKLNMDTLLKSGIPAHNIKEAESIANAIFLEVRANPKNWSLAPGALAFLESLVKKNKRIAIVDNWDSHLATFVERSEIGKYISLVVSGGDLQHRKPEPFAFQFAMERFDVKPDQCVHIGNRYIDDVIGARNAGVTPIIYDPYRKYLKEDFLCFYRFSDLVL